MEVGSSVTVKHVDFDRRNGGSRPPRSERMIDALARFPLSLSDTKKTGTLITSAAVNPLQFPPPTIRHRTLSSTLSLSSAKKKKKKKKKATTTKINSFLPWQYE